MSKLLHFDQLRSVLVATVTQLPDRWTRPNPQYRMADAALAAFAVFFMQSPSFLAHQRDMQRLKGQNNAASLFGPDAVPSDPQIRNLLDPVPPEQLAAPFWQVFAQLRAGDYLTAYQGHLGPWLCALDGTQYFGSEQIACARATLAVTRYQPEAVATQARRALEYLRFRFTANWALSVAYFFQGDRAAAGRVIAEALAISQKSASLFSAILALSHLGRLQELAGQLHRAVETNRRVLQLAGDQPGPSANDACLGLARICYEWNDLDAAQQYAQQSLQLARLYDRVLDRFIISEVFLARLQAGSAGAVRAARKGPGAATAGRGAGAGRRGRLHSALRGPGRANAPGDLRFSIVH